MTGRGCDLASAAAKKSVVPMPEVCLGTGRHGDGGHAVATESVPEPAGRSVSFRKPNFKRSVRFSSLNRASSAATDRRTSFAVSSSSDCEAKACCERSAEAATTARQREELLELTDDICDGLRLDALLGDGLLRVTLWSSKVAAPSAKGPASSPQSFAVEVTGALFCCARHGCTTSKGALEAASDANAATSKRLSVAALKPLQRSIASKAPANNDPHVAKSNGPEPKPQLSRELPCRTQISTW